MSDSKSSDQEIFESIPWEELRDLGDTSRRRRGWFLVGGTAAVAVLVFSVVRTFSGPDPQMVAPQITIPPATAVPDSAAFSPLPEVSVPLPPPPDPLPAAPPPMTEADLRAGGDSWDERRAASYSEWFVLEFFTLDGPGRSASLQRWLPNITQLGVSDASDTALSYVEWARTLWVEPLADERWRAVVALRRLVSTDGAAYSRLPTQSVEVVVDLGAGIPAIVDLPRFIPLPEATPAQWWVGEQWEIPPAAVVRTARDEMLLTEAGNIAGKPAVSQVGEAWRVEWAVIDPAGISWPVSIWLSSEGAPLPSGG